MDRYGELAQAIVDGDEIQVLKTVRRLLKNGADPLKVISVGLVGGMESVGYMFSKKEIFISDVIISARVMKSGIDLVRRMCKAPARRPLGKVVLGTVKGDIHDIGKNLVGIMLEIGGFLVFDLGVNVEPQQFVKAVKERNAQILAMSAQLTTTVLNMQTTIEAIKAAGMRDDVKIIIGGLAVSRRFADKIGADGYSHDASSAVCLCRRLLKIRQTGGRNRGPDLRIVKRQRRERSDT